MRFSPRSTLETIRDECEWLTTTPHAFRLVSESDGMGGAVEYRSEALWIAVLWDRGLPWLAFAPTRSSVGRFDWELVDHLLRDAARFEAGTGVGGEAPAAELARWLRPRLGDIEARFTPPRLSETNARLVALQAERAAEREAYWRAREDNWQQQSDGG